MKFLRHVLVLVASTVLAALPSLHGQNTSSTTAAPTPTNRPPRGGAFHADSLAPSPTELPSMYAGYVTLPEYLKLRAYEASLRTDPEVADLNARTQALAAEWQTLQARLEAARKRVLAKNPEMDAIAQKERSAILAHIAANPPPTGTKSTAQVKAPSIAVPSPAPVKTP